MSTRIYHRAMQTIAEDMPGPRLHALIYETTYGAIIKFSDGYTSAISRRALPVAVECIIQAARNHARNRGATSVEILERQSWST